MNAALATFGSNVRTHRLARGVSQEKLAEFAGLDVSFVSDVERGHRNATIISIHKLAQSLGVTVAELMKGVQ